MIARVREYIWRHRMIEPGDRVVAGVSGGADSVFLLLILRDLQAELSFSLSAVHVEHGLRGKESLEDAAFVEGLCQQAGVPCRMFQVDMLSEARRMGYSLEEAGRELRYACFAEACRELGGGKIAVAHHRDDQAETVLLHLFRGSGLRGLCGMAPVRGNVIRPLLELERKEIEEWLGAHGMKWRMDRTNLETAYTRNKLRLQVLPFVEREIQPGAGKHAALAAEHLRQVQEYVDGQARRCYESCALELRGKAEEPEKRMEPGKAQHIWQIRICLESFWQQEPLMRRMVLQLALERLGEGLRDVGAVHLKALEELANKESGRELALPHKVCVRKEYESLVFERRGKARERKEPVNLVIGEIPGTYAAGGLFWRFSLEDGKKYQKIPEKTYTKWFDYDRIIQCLSIRSRCPGDFLEINREHGKKKLKDYLIDSKVSREERDRLLLLADGQHILWIPGRRISEGYKVTGQTKRLLRVEIFGGNTNDRENQGDDPRGGG